MLHPAGRRLGAALSALLATATVGACRSGVDEQSEHPHAASSSAGTSSGADSASAVGRPAQPSLQSAAERWQQHPDQAPEGVSDSGLLLNRRGRGPGTIALPDIRGNRSLLMTLTCASDSYYRLDLRDAGGRDLARLEGDCSVLNVYRTGPLDPGDLPVQVQVETPRTVDYYVTVYGIA